MSITIESAPENFLGNSTERSRRQDLVALNMPVLRLHHANPREHRWTAFLQR
jgi:hypothetical protein